jgi:hypothetical protein
MVEVAHLRATLKDRAATTVGPKITINYAKSILSIDNKTFYVPTTQPGGLRRNSSLLAARKIWSRSAFAGERSCRRS